MRGWLKRLAPTFPRMPPIFSSCSQFWARSPNFPVEPSPIFGATVTSRQRWHELYKGCLAFKKVHFFWTFFKRGGGQPMFKNFVGNCRSFWRSFNNMKFAWKGTFEAWMVKFGGEIGTLYQIFTPCTPLPKYKRAFTWFLGGSNSLPGCRRIFYRGLP